MPQFLKKNYLLSHLICCRQVHQLMWGKLRLFWLIRELGKLFPDRALSWGSCPQTLKTKRHDVPHRKVRVGFKHFLEIEAFDESPKQQSSNLPWWFPPIPQEGDFQNDRSSDEGERRTSWQPYPKEWKRQSHHLSWLLNLGGDLESWPLPSSLVVSWPEFSGLLCLPFWREGFSYHWPQCSQCTQCPQVHVEFSAL